MTIRRTYLNLSIVLIVLTMVVMVFGAYVRLTDAGLGCPDWPGCYGKLLVPAEKNLSADDQWLAQRPLEVGKAWREMIHRYLASALGLGILCLAGITFYRRQTIGVNPSVAYCLVPLVMFQGALGMWTVTLLLKPLIVTAHLLGGLITLSLLFWNTLQVKYLDVSVKVPNKLKMFVWFGLVTVFCQIFLGGWTSTNYAALACTELPTCGGKWFPSEQLGEAFTLWRGLGIDYEYGVLDTPARMSIHMVHRIGAVVTTIVLLLLIWRSITLGNCQIKKLAWVLLCVLTCQIFLGLMNIVGGLPISVAVAHNGVGAILFLVLVTMLFFTRTSD